MSRFSLDDFMKTGSILGVFKGMEIKEVSHKVDLIPSQMLDDNGDVNLYDFKMDGVRFRVGVENSLVSYLMIPLDKYNQNVVFTIGEEDVRNKSLSWFLEFLNKTDLDWEYKTSLGKVLVVSIGQNLLEFVYSYEKEEEGIYCFQTYIDIPTTT